MKKVLLTLVVAFATLAASAQFMVVTTYDGDQEESMTKLTAHLGFGYQMTDDFTLGAVRSPGTAETIDGVDTTAATDDGYEIFIRYNLSFMDGMYAILKTPMEDMTENMDVGVGMSFSIWNNLYIEPNYTMPVSEDDDGNRDGSFNIGIGYRF